jgi:hypothetical protein
MQQVITKQLQNAVIHVRVFHTVFLAFLPLLLKQTSCTAAVNGFSTLTGWTNLI